MSELSRTKFGLILGVLKPMTPIVRIGYQNYKHKQTPFNAGMAYNLANAIDGEYPEYQLNYKNLKVSRGPIDTAHNVRVDIDGFIADVVWDMQYFDGKDDEAFIAVLNAEDGEAKLIENGNLRRLGKMRVSIPADWSGKEVHVYLAFRRGDNVSDSVHVGPLKVS